MKIIRKNVNETKPMISTVNECNTYDMLSYSLQTEVILKNLRTYRIFEIRDKYCQNSSHNIIAKCTL
jgi:hypothetical protein